MLEVQTIAPKIDLFKSDKYILLHFVPNILSPGCSMEINDLKTKYNNLDSVETIIVSSNTQSEIDSWVIENDIKWKVYCDSTLELTDSYQCRDEEYNVPRRYTVFISPDKKIEWIIDNELKNPRQVVTYNDLIEQVIQSKA